MKPSDLTTEQMFDALVAIAPEIQPILQDEALFAELTKVATEKEKATQIGMQKMANLVPLLFGKYRQNIFRILAALNGKNSTEIAAQGWLETVKQVIELFRDKDMLDFFYSLRSMEQSK